MAFFDEIKSKVGTAADAAADKAKELKELAKLKSEITSQENSISAAFLEMGKKMYEAEKDKPDSSVADLCKKITDANAAIDELKTKIAALKAD